jgi:hypothetical protein
MKKNIDIVTCKKECGRQTANNQGGLLGLLRKSIVLNIALVFFLATGCKKFVEIGPPDTRLVTPSVFANSATATAAQTVIYTRMFNNRESFNMASNTGLTGDELKNYATALLQVQLYTNSLQAGSNLSVWSNMYNYIYQVNANIEGLAKYGGGSEAVARQLTAEAKFLRAFCYFYLVNLYGDVPLLTTSDYTINAFSTRTPAADVYQQIIKDLKDAQSNLNTNFVDVDDISTTAERVRPTKWAATALLARVYLYTKDYPNAEIQATAVINQSSDPTVAASGRIRLYQGLDSVFLKNSEEAIWQLATPGPSSYNTADGNTFILRTAPNNVSLTDQLINSFEPGDKRRLRWVGAYTPPSGTPVYYFPNKYKALSVSPTTECTMVLRLGEQFLIRAEARAWQNNLSGAASDLNMIRSRAGLLSYSGAMDMASLLDAILRERRVELFTEWGHRWFDLKRVNTIDPVMTLQSPLKGGAWVSYKKLYPIQQTEINTNPNLLQNPGY